MCRAHFYNVYKTSTLTDTTLAVLFSKHLQSPWPIATVKLKLKVQSNVIPIRRWTKTFESISSEWKKKKEKKKKEKKKKTQYNMQQNFRVKDLDSFITYGMQ